MGLTVLLLALSYSAEAAETPQQSCDRLAGDPAVKLENIDAASAVPRNHRSQANCNFVR
jgi:hypothetical protein